MHTGSPCRYTGGHFDHYVARYSSWQAGGLDEGVFDKPPHCKPEGVQVMARRPGLDLRTELLSLLPPAHHGAIWRWAADAPVLHQASCWTVKCTGAAARPLVLPVVTED